jgi:hypothetical protein
MISTSLSSTWIVPSMLATLRWCISPLRRRGTAFAVILGLTTV